MTDIDATTLRRNRRQLLLIGGIPVLGMLLMTLLWYVDRIGWIELPSLLGTKNRGVLVDPVRPVPELQLRDARGEPVSFGEAPVWTLMIPGGGRCDDACEQTLYITRQLHIAMGRNANRLRRVYVSVEGEIEPTFRALTETEHPRLVTAFTDFDQLKDLLRGLGIDDPLAPGYFFLVDPQGWLMMYYSDAHTPKDIQKDLKVVMSAANH